jgi:uncharacterized membrane protein
MKHPVAHLFLPWLCLGLFAVVSVVALALLWFTIVRPAQWSRMVDKENDFWVGKGFISASTSEWFRRFEKGRGQKVLIGLIGLLGIVGFICMTLLFRHHGHR